MSLLLEKFKIKSLELKNRIVVSPMCQYSAENGYANDWHLVHLGSRAVGGAALVMVEATAIEPEGRISYGDLGLWENGQITKLKQITEFIESQEAIAAIQLAHAGRKGSTNKPWLNFSDLADGNKWQTVAPSAIPFKDGWQIPSVLTKERISNIIEKFAKSAKMAVEAGFKIIEIHAAHGYLIHQFLSPVSNQRTDEYGGSFDNRIRFVKEIVKVVKAAVPDEVSLWIRISATDWVENGWNLDDSIQLINILKNEGIDVVDVSTGGNVFDAEIPVQPNYQVPFAKEIKAKTGLTTGAVGLITEAQQAEKILQNNEADLIFMAREFLRDPYFPLNAAKELSEEIMWPDQYLRAK